MNTPTFNLSNPFMRSQRASMAPSSPTHLWRIEERRTIYVSSDTPNPRWSSERLDEILNHRNSQIERQVQVAPQGLVDETYGRLDTSGRDSRSYKGERSSRSSPTSGSPRNSYKGSPRLSTRDTPPSSPQRESAPVLPARHRILFYHRHDPHYGFTNFSPHPVIYQGKRYPTSEHLFQSFKFHDHRPQLAEHIRTCSEKPSVALSEARRFKPEARHDWFHVNIPAMDDTLWLKFTQHLDLQQELLQTGDAELVEDSNKDSFWGVGADGRGRNELGKALVRLRSKLRANGPRST